MAAKSKTKQKPDKRPLTVAETATALIWYVNGAKTVEQIARDLGVTDRAVDSARLAGDWDDALDVARQALAHAAKDYAKGLADVQRQVCEDDLRVGDRLARISDRLIKALDATLAEMDAADDKGASACEWRLSRLAASWERVQRARRLAVNLHTDKVATGDDGGQQLREDLFRRFNARLDEKDPAGSQTGDAGGLVQRCEVGPEQVAEKGSGGQAS